MKKPTESEFIRFISKINFRYHDSGVMKNKDNSKAGLYLKGDILSDEQKEKLKEKFGEWVQFFKAQSQYAPESVKSIVLLVSANNFKKSLTAR